MPLRVFISYARKDDDPLTSRGTGFVTRLSQRLTSHFNRLGPPAPALWKDGEQIRPSDQFDDVIRSGIEAAHVLLVVLSRNWIDRPYCRKELELFRARWSTEDEKAVRRRVVVVCKNYVPDDSRPSLLSGQDSYRFYARASDAEPGEEREFSEFGEVTDKFVDLARDIALDLWSRMRSPESVASKPMSKADLARTVYVAQPADDVRRDYDRLVAELRGNNLTIVPDPTEEIPYKSGRAAQEFVEAALRRAWCSVHLLGEEHGYAPAGGDPIVDLQLACAAAFAASAGSDNDKVRFRRIIWAPKVLLGVDGSNVADRTPSSVIARFGGFVSGDVLEGNQFDSLIGFVTRLLERTASSAPVAPPPTDANGPIYIYYNPIDRDYATTVARTLKSLQFRLRVPVRSGLPSNIRQLHNKALVECDSVVLCWANASDSWIMARSNEWKNWRALGRARNFSARALVVGPPDDSEKRDQVEFADPEVADVIVDLMNGVVTPESLEELTSSLRPRNS